MIEFGLPLRGQQLSSCMNAIYSYFAPRWGSFTQNGFTLIPDVLKSLRPTLLRKNKFLGGLYDLELKAFWNIKSNDYWNISLQKRFGNKTRFTTKSKHEDAIKLTSKLNENIKLITTLDEIDLVGVHITLKNGKIELGIIPMGGGICYLVVPPVRYIVPLPSDQRFKLTSSIEQIAFCLDRIVDLRFQ